jgi:hypothetical protein
MLRAYCGHCSVAAGGLIRLHVAATDHETDFRGWFFRLAEAWEFRGTSPIWQTRVVPEGRSNAAWGWPAYGFEVPSEWPSGAYVVVLADARSGAPEPDRAAHDRSTALFVVKNSTAHAAPILYKLPLFTYCAYNAEGGGSLYTGPHDQVTLHRPGCGVGGEPCDSATADAYDLSSPRQTFAHWDAPFIRWLESNGYVVDYCTDLDIHESSCRLESYRLLLSVGHDEYWSQEMRSNVERFIASGRNVAFFGGNICWWRVHLNAGNTTISCDKHKRPGDTEAFDQWMGIDPETRLTGVSFRYGGGWWTGRRHAVGYRVQHADHWVFAGLGLKDGDIFGGAPDQALVGYECDGAALSQKVSSEGYILPSYANGTPDTFQILGVGELAPDWEYLEGGRGAAATMGIYRNGGTVFTAATTDWARVLAQRDPIVEGITRNVLDRLQGSS